MLTPREKEIMLLYAEGMTDEGVAQALNISHKTVNHHHERVKARFEARNRAHLIAILFRRRLIE